MKNNNSLIYDESRKNEMQDFLTFIYTLFVQNPDFDLNFEIIYSLLSFEPLPSNDKDEFGKGNNINRFFDRWEDKFINKKTEAFCDKLNWSYFFQFVNGLGPRTNYIKLYVPINTTHIYEGANELFDYLESENIKHQSKISEEVKTDNVIIRLEKGDYKSVNKIINYINNNNYLKTGLNKTNPFIPAINGIGVMNDHGGSYNYSISKLIYSYLKECKELGKEKVNIDNFRAFIIEKNKDEKEKSEFEMDDNVLDTFEIAYSGKKEILINSKNNELEQTKEFKIPKDKLLLNQQQKIGLLMECINVTFNKYGYEQTEHALIKAITEGDYQYFSRGKSGFDLREQLKTSITSNEMSTLIKNSLKDMVPPRMISPDIIPNIKIYTRAILLNNTILQFDEACNATLYKYDKNQLASAIELFIKQNNVQKFTKYLNNKKINYRDVIKRIGSNNVIHNIEQSLKSKGNETYGLKDEELIINYVNMLEQMKYDTKQIKR